MTLDEILETRFCCQTKCPHIGDGVTCRECKTEKYKELYEPAEKEDKDEH